MATRQLQLWKCKECGHTLYTAVGKKQGFFRRLFSRPERIECPACYKGKAKKVRIVTKEIRE